MVNDSYHNINKLVINAIKKYIVSKPDIYSHFNFSHNRQKHSLDTILNELVEIIKYAKPYRSSKIIPHSTLKDAYDRLCKYNVFEDTYKKLLNRYIKKCPSKKLKIRHVDTTCIVNKYGSDCANYFGHKKRVVTKISFETDSFGIPIKMTINNGSMNDGKILMKDFKIPHLIDKDIVDRYKKYFCADSLYDTKVIRSHLIENNQIPIIKPNKRNTKNAEMIKDKIFTEKQKSIYNERCVIEFYNGLIKSIRRIQTRYDRKLDTFKNAVYFGMIDRIIKL